MTVFVTGIGALSAIGMNAEENLQSLQSERTGILYSPTHGLMLGSVPLSNQEMVQMLGLPEGDYSRTSLLGMIAAREAWEGNAQHPDIRTGLVSATSIGGLDRMEAYYFEDKASNAAPPDNRMVHENGSTTERIAEYLGIAGYIDTVSTACSSGANAIMMGARLLEAKLLDRVLVGGADPLTLFNIKGFSALNIYDQEICKPFDEVRKGLNMGEGAAYLLLENTHSIGITRHAPLCALSGWNNATDAYHQTASSPNGDGAYLAMVQALAKAGVGPEKIDYINAHGTGTGNNDLSESIAIKRVFGEMVPAFSSTKGFTGHTLAAAGALEAVYCVLSIRENAIPPNLNFLTPMKETGMTPVTSFRSWVKIDYALSNSFGFGGNCTCLIFNRLP